MMKRQIKFRAWIRGGTWNDDETERKFVMIDGDDLAFEEHKPLCDLLRDVNDEAYYMQFTGLHDKNGKEIYEGDIVFDGGINKVIIWKGGGFNVQHPAYKPNSELPTRPLWMDSLTHGEQLQMEVIGNIYENPELLEP